LQPRRKALLIIMDGVGHNPSKLDNAVALANTPNLDRIYASTPTTVIEASGRPVGLPDGQMGNSEVGHLTLGAGRVLKQDLVKISDAIEDGSFFDNEALGAAVKTAKDGSRPLHLIGLVSDGGVHSHVEHALACIELCARHGVAPLLHMITDGRDTAPAIAATYLDAIEPALAKAGGAIASVSGRYFALDRDKRWERVEKAWRAIALGEGARADDARSAIAAAHGADVTDEFIEPTVLSAHQVMLAGDVALFFNFRNDRPRELAEALASEHFEGFDRAGAGRPQLTTMTRYHADYPFPFAFSRDRPEATLGQVVSEAGIRQLRSAETEKYPHVTFFFNGGQDAPFEGEERRLVDSPKVSTYDLAPEMSARGVTDGVLDGLRSKEFGLVVVNLANGDMVGHTGVREAVVSAVETVDAMVGELWDTALANDYSVVLTADHGNADMLLDPVTGSPHTQHTTFPVACAVHDERARTLGTGHALTSIAPTLLELMGLEIPAGMDAKSLLLD
jgi:2,3-bisphosphoglycerate-independent phosphoglycerate mutase